MVKNLPASAGDAGDPGSILGSGGSPKEGNGKPLQYSYLGNPMDRGTSVSSVQLFSHVWLFATPWTAARQACPSSTPRAYSNSCPLSRWCLPTNSSSVVPFSCLQSFPASGCFQMSQFFALGGQSIGSFSFSISLSNEYSELISFRINWFDLAVQGISKV